MPNKYKYEVKLIPSSGYLARVPDVEFIIITLQAFDLAKAIDFSHTLYPDCEIISAHLVYIVN